MLEKSETETNAASSSSAAAASSQVNHSDTLYLCQFRVSVDGDWLCLKEVEDSELAASAASEVTIPISSK